MPNETIQELTYESVTAITQNPKFIFISIIVLLVPIIIYILIGAIVKGGGKFSSKRMIEYSNFWWGIFVWGVLQTTLFVLLIIFPIWLNLFNS